MPKLPVTPSTDSVKMSTPKSGTPALKPLPPTVRTVPVAAEPSYQRSNLEIQTEGQDAGFEQFLFLLDQDEFPRSAMEPDIVGIPGARVTAPGRIADQDIIHGGRPLD